jgi:hypothetical protein
MAGIDHWAWRRKLARTPYRLVNAASWNSRTQAHAQDQLHLYPDDDMGRCISGTSPHKPDTRNSAPQLLAILLPSFSLSSHRTTHKTVRPVLFSDYSTRVRTHPNCYREIVCVITLTKCNSFEAMPGTRPRCAPSSSRPPASPSYNTTRAPRFDTRISIRAHLRAT